MMLVVVAYDVKRRRRRVGSASGGLLAFVKIVGSAFQNSVFECLVDAAHGSGASAMVEEISEEQDSLRFYFLGGNWKPRVDMSERRFRNDPQGPLIA